MSKSPTLEYFGESTGQDTGQLYFGENSAVNPQTYQTSLSTEFNVNVSTIKISLDPQEKMFTTKSDL